MTVFSVDTLDDAVQARLRECAQAGTGRVVLVARDLDEADFLEVMGVGVRVIVRSHDVTPERLARAITAAADGHGDLSVDLVGRLLALVVSVRRNTGREGGAGRYLSVWDTVGDGTSWLTELKADGTHTLAHARRTDHDGAWRLTVPALDASLAITHSGLPGSRDGLYTGVCSVTGMLEGQNVTGHGYTDIIG